MSPGDPVDPSSARRANRGSRDALPSLAPRWKLSPPPFPGPVARLQEALGVPHTLCALMVSRGITEPSEAKSYLRPVLTDLHPPQAMPDVDQATSRILSAVEKGERVFVHGDYDVDGMAGTALLTRWLRRLGGEVVPFVPNRLRDGYDLGQGGLDTALAHGCSLLISVDCGIQAHDTVEQAISAGMDVIVTDHHEPGITLPPALAVLNPRRADSAYPDTGLAGTGVAFKLCHALAQAAGVEEEELFSHLDLVGLATVADLVPLKGENRILARFGLKALGRSRNPGLRALMEETGIRPETVSAGTVGFGLAPRLNALGRLGEAQDGLELLLTDDPSEARRLARGAEEVNRARQEKDSQTLTEALSELEKSFDGGRDFGIVLASEGWHPGVIGIVASRIVERVHRPVVLLALEGSRGRGSGRSIPEYHLLEGIGACGSHLIRFGGHRMAAGMEIQSEDVAGFRAAFNEHARQALEGRDLRPILPVELEVGLDEISWDLHKFMAYLGPHGIGNPRPNLVARDITCSIPPRMVGSGHLKLRLEQEGVSLDAIGFNLAHRIPPKSLGSAPMDVVFQLGENTFRGRSQLQARIKDIRPSEVREDIHSSEPWVGDPK